MKREPILLLSMYFAAALLAAYITAIEINMKPVHLGWEKLVAASLLSAAFSLPYLFVAASALVIISDNDNEEKDLVAECFIAWLVIGSLATFYLVTLCLARCLAG